MRKKLLSFFLAMIMVLTPILGIMPAKADENKIQESVELSVERLAGNDRYETAVEISKEVFPQGTDVAVIASGENFADALVGGNLASHVGGPVLLVRKDLIPKVIEEELKRLGLDKIYLVGGESSVSKQVETRLESFADEVVRLSGLDRYKTSVEVAKELVKLGANDGVAYAAGTNFADALAGTALLAHLENHILVLSDQGLISEASPRSDNSIVFGGTSSIYIEELENPTTYAGRDRYMTALDIAERGFEDFDTIILVDGTNYPDALTAVSLANKHGAPILLTNPQNINDEVLAFIHEKADRVIIVGGENSVSQDVEGKLRSRVQAPVETENPNEEDETTDSEERPGIEDDIKNNDRNNPQVTKPINPEKPEVPKVPEETEVIEDPAFEDMVNEKEIEYDQEGEVDDIVKSLKDDFIDGLLEILDGYGRGPETKGGDGNFFLSLLFEKVYAKDVFTFHIPFDAELEDVIRYEKEETETGWKISFATTIEVRKNGEIFETFDYIYIVNLNKAMVETDFYQLAFVVRSSEGNVQVPFTIVDSEGNEVDGAFDEYDRWFSNSKELGSGIYTLTFNPSGSFEVIGVDNVNNKAEPTENPNIFTIELSQDNTITADSITVWGNFRLEEVQKPIDTRIPRINRPTSLGSYQYQVSKEHEFKNLVEDAEYSFRYFESRTKPSDESLIYEGLPQGLSFDPATNILSGVPEVDINNFVGGGVQYRSIEVTATNPSSGITFVKDYQIAVNAPRFSINIDESIENGRIKTSHETRAVDGKVSLSVGPAEGYELEKIKVTDEEGNEVSFLEDEEYTFRMPASDVRVSGSFKKIPKPEGRLAIRYITGDYFREGFTTYYKRLNNVGDAKVEVFRIEGEDKTPVEVVYNDKGNLHQFEALELENGIYELQVTAPEGYQLVLNDDGSYQAYTGTDSAPNKVVSNRVAIPYLESNPSMWQSVHIKVEEYTKENFNVTFDTNGGLPTIDPQIVSEGELVEVPKRVVKDNMKFEGWYEGDEKFDFNQPIDRDLNLKAVWSKTGLNIRYFATPYPGAEIVQLMTPYRNLNADTVILYVNGEKVGEEAYDGGLLPANTSIRFELDTPLGEDDLLTADALLADEIVSTASTTVRAWEASVFFNTDGGEPKPETQKVLAGTYAKEPEEPVKEGFKFLGWYRGNEASAFDFENTKIRGITSLKARWEALPAQDSEEESLSSGRYILVDSNNQSPDKLDGTWVSRSEASENPNTMTNTWTLEVDGNFSKIRDRNGTYIRPRGGNENGIRAGEYEWEIVENEDGSYSFKGQGLDTVYFANNKSSNGYRAYKASTIANSSNYPYKFNLYLIEKLSQEDIDMPVETGLSTISQARDSSGLVSTKGFVTFLDGRNITIQDESGGIVFRAGRPDHGALIGDEILITGTRGFFNNLEQINDNGHPIKIISSGNDLPKAKELSIAELLDNGELYESQRVLIRDVEFGVESSRNTPVIQGSNSINIYNLTASFAVPANTRADLTAVVGQFRDDYQLRVAEKDDIEIIELGQGSNPSGEFVKINQIQGSTFKSPMEGQEARVKAIVITPSQDYFNRGYYIHSLEEDIDDKKETSEGLFIQTDYTGLSRGDVIIATGRVNERKLMSSWDDQLTVTSLSNAWVEKTGESYSEAQLDSLVKEVNVTDIPTVVSNQKMTEASHGSLAIDITDAMGFYESLEAMPVKISQGEIVGQIENYGDITVLPNRGEGAEVIRTSSHGVKYDYEHPNTQTITISDKIIPITKNNKYIDPNFKPYPGKYFDGDIEGVFAYGFSDIKLLNYKPLPELAGEGISPEGRSELSRDENSITASIYNVWNFSARDTDRAPLIAGQIVNNLNSPDILALVEIQDNDGGGTLAGQDASATLQLLVDEIGKAGGPVYEYVNIDPQEGNREGGAPNANIRPAYLYNPSKLKLSESIDGRPSSPTEEMEIINRNGEFVLKQNPTRYGHNLQGPGQAFESTRLPLIAQFEILKGNGKGQNITLINNHLSSKRGDTPIIGPVQPQDRLSEPRRWEQAKEIAGIVKEIHAINPEEHIVVLGDLNDYELSETLNILTSQGNLANLIEYLPENDRSSYIYQGNSQVLDHILVSQSLNRLKPKVDILNINAGFTEADGRASDHDPVLAKITFNPVEKQN